MVEPLRDTYSSVFVLAKNRLIYLHALIKTFWIFPSTPHHSKYSISWESPSLSSLSELSKVSFSASLEAKKDLGAHSEHSLAIHDDAELRLHAFFSTRLCETFVRGRRNLLQVNKRFHIKRFHITMQMTVHNWGCLGKFQSSPCLRYPPRWRCWAKLLASTEGNVSEHTYECHFPYLFTRCPFYQDLCTWYPGDQKSSETIPFPCQIKPFALFHEFQPALVVFGTA